jgi:hypothetical protein
MLHMTKGCQGITPNISIYEMSDVTTEDRKTRRSPTVQNVLHLPKLPRYTRLLMQGKQDMRSEECEKRKTKWARHERQMRGTWERFLTRDSKRLDIRDIWCYEGEKTHKKKNPSVH